MIPIGNYPAHLSPQLGFSYLSVAQLTTQERYLLRAVEGELIYDEGGYLDASCICNPRERLLDLSVNVLGTFTPTDGRWRVSPHQSWQPGQVVQMPTTVSHWQPYDWYAVAIDRLHQQPTTCMTNGQVVHCYVCHDPTHANYWHFVVRFAVEQGGNIARLPLTKGAKRLLLGDIRSWLRQLIGRQPQPLCSPSTSIPLHCCQHQWPDNCP